MPPTRTFVAVEVADSVRRRAVGLIGRLSASGAAIKWVEPENLHITLCFLGDVDMPQLPAVCQAVAESVASFEPFAIGLKGAGAFPQASRPRTLWLGVESGAREMIALHDAVELALEPLGFRPEQRRFHPHLTLGRLRKSPQGSGRLGQLLEETQEYSAGTTQVTEVTVYSSRLDRGGPKYEVLARAELEG